jgi:excisionase family DNA binding protein
MKTVDEAAAALDVSPRRVRALIAAGKLDAEKVGGVWLIDEASLARREDADVDRRGGRPRHGASPEEMELVLMNREHAVVEAVYDSERNVFTKVGSLLDAARAPLGLVNERGKISPAVLSSWWSDRGIPRARKGVADILASLGATVPEELVYRNLGLSLSDQYWVKPKRADVTWSQLNFFDNDFEQLAMDSEGESDGPGRHPDNTSDGVLPKHWLVTPNRTRVLAKSGGEFLQEPCNEVVASELCRRIMPAARYVTYGLGGWSGSLACFCPNFLSDVEEFVPAHYVRMTQKQASHHSDYQHYLECCHALGVEEPELAISYGIVCDDLMANTDRHWRNFGLVRNVETLECRIAPIFDTGSSLWHDRPDLLFSRDFTFTGKQFEANPGRQLQLAELDWLETAAIQDLDEFAREILSKSLLPEERIGLICQGIRWRVGRMTSIREYL